MRITSLISTSEVKKKLTDPFINSLYICGAASLFLVEPLLRLFLLPDMKLPWLNPIYTGPDTMLSASCVSPHCISEEPRDLSTFAVPILQMGMEAREVKQFAFGHTASRRWKSMSLTPKSRSEMKELGFQMLLRIPPSIGSVCPARMVAGVRKTTP